jgi:hypothetical protein
LLEAAKRHFHLLRVHCGFVGDEFRHFFLAH